MRSPEHLLWTGSWGTGGKGRIKTECHWLVSPDNGGWDPVKWSGENRTLRLEPACWLMIQTRGSSPLAGGVDTSNKPAMKITAWICSETIAPIIAQTFFLRRQERSIQCAQVEDSMKRCLEKQLSLSPHLLPHRPARTPSQNAILVTAQKLRTHCRHVAAQNTSRRD